MERMYAHLLAEILAADGMPVRWARLQVFGHIDTVWCLIMVMELLYVLALYTPARTRAMFGFFAAYAVILTIV